MNQAEIKKLIEKAVGKQETWADFGSGEGAFTLVLRELGGRETKIFSLDIDESGLKSQERKILFTFPDTKIKFVHGDCTKNLKLPPLDGLLLANSLHFIPDQTRLLADFRYYLKPGGKLVLVEYDIEGGNSFVPYPIPFEKFKLLARVAGYATPVLLSEIPSRYWSGIYCAFATNPN